MSDKLILMLIAAYLRKLINPSETDQQTATGITDDLKKFSTYLSNLDKTDINR